jgi:phosphatidylglycerol:prolipoprotein diacylglycerol transferase
LTLIQKTGGGMNSLIHWWQHLPEKMNPVLFEIGAFKLQYYGLMYIVAFTITYLLVSYRLKKETVFDVTGEQAQGLLTAMIIGLILGARLGYVLFYNLPYYAAHPLEVILPFEFSKDIRFTGISGMSYHGGLIGVILATILYSKRTGLEFFSVADLFIPAIPLGYTFGRLGNFINGELYGRVTTRAIGMFFPQAPTHQLRHPSQLYEAFFEGIVLFAILWSIRRRVRTQGAMLAIYLMGYGFVRFFIEYLREPDAHLGFVLATLSMGQVLCTVMILSGLTLLFYLKKRQ